MVKKFLQKYQVEIILFIGVVLISLISFALGYIVAKMEEKEPLQFEDSNVNLRNFQPVLNSKLKPI